MALAFGTLLAGAETGQEYAVKAAFLFNLAKFVEWPEAGSPEPLLLGVLGEDPFGEVLDRSVNNKVVNGRPVAIKRASSVEQLTDCQILFISSSENKRLKQILKVLEGRPILTVGDNENFIRAGGMIALVLEQNKVVLEINIDQAARASLKISSRALQVARIVHRP